MKLRYLFAIFLIALGSFVILSSAGVDIPFNPWMLLPLALALGIISTKRRIGVFTTALILISVYSVVRDCLITYNITTLPDLIRWHYIVPALLILWGVSIFYKPVYIHGKIDKTNSQSYISSQGKKITSRTSFGSDSASFSGGGFTGGNINVSFGESNIDLTGIIADSGPLILDVGVAFGSANIRIPYDWSVDTTKVSNVFGSTNLKNTVPSEPAAALVIVGSVSFGSLEILN